MTQVLECLPRKHSGLNSIPTTRKKKKDVKRMFLTKRGEKKHDEQVVCGY
jgi:hypothetical protein